MSEYTDEEIISIDYDFFDKIKSQIEINNINRTKKILDKKFDFYDYQIRGQQKIYLKNLKNFFLNTQVDFNEVKRQ